MEAAHGVDQHVDAAPLRERALDEHARLLEVGHVGAHRDRLAAGLLDLGGHGFGRVLVASGVDDHARLLGARGAGERPAQAAAAAGHQEHAAAQAVVVHLPVTRTISVVVVAPRKTFSIAASLSVRRPSSRAALKISSELACCETRRRIFSLIGRIS